MKNLFFTTLFLVSAISFAQTATGFGFKGGLNYNANGDYIESISSTAQNPEGNVGYHFGIFYKIGNELYLKPELVYTSTKSGYENGDFKMQKIDLPAIVGLKVIGPLSVFAGPSFQYILDSDFGGVSIKNIEKDFSVGLNFGVALNLKKVGIDLRYERGFSSNEALFISNNIGENTVSRLDTRPNQLIIGLSLVL